MLPKKDAVQLVKKMAYGSAARWREREFMRNIPGSLKGETAEERVLSDARIKKHFLRESNRRPVSIDLSRPILFPEGIVKGNDLKEFPPNEIARKAGKPVVRIQTIPATGLVAEGFATGFMVSPNLMLTNWHVFPDSQFALNCAANFQFERTVAGVSQGFPFALNPGKFFFNDEKLDFALVYVEPVSIDNRFSLSNFGFLNLYATPGKIIIGQAINIIQHPKGGIKQYAFLNNTIVDILENEGFVHYTTDTQKGSSGSGCMNASWEVAALHHGGIPLIINNQIIDKRGNPWDDENQDEDEVQWLANEGVSISKIIETIKTFIPSGQEQQKILSAFLETTKDPLVNNSPVAMEKNSELIVPGTKIIIPANPSSLKDKSMSTYNFTFHGNVNIYINDTAATDTRMITTSGGPVAVPEKKQNFDPAYDKRPNFDTSFIDGFTLSLPAVTPDRQDELFLNFNTNTPQVLNYHHFCLVHNKSRRLMMWSASNVDYSEDKRSNRNRESFGGEDWRPDPRIPISFQITDPEFYKPATRVDRGHIVRRDDNCWGDTELEIEFANADTYHWTNCTPQHESFNQGNKKGLWGMLENTIQEQLQLADNRATIFAGPVLNNDKDPFAEFNDVKIQYPVKFWKIVVVNDEEQGLSAYGFILDQSNVIKKLGLEKEALDFSLFKKQQVSIRKITALTGVIFDSQIYEADILLNTSSFESGFRSFNQPEELLIKRK